VNFVEVSAIMRNYKNKHVFYFAHAGRGASKGLQPQSSRREMLKIRCVLAPTCEAQPQKNSPPGRGAESSEAGWVQRQATVD